MDQDDKNIAYWIDETSERFASSQLLSASLIRRLFDISYLSQVRLFSSAQSCPTTEMVKSPGQQTTKSVSLTVTHLSTADCLRKFSYLVLQTAVLLLRGLLDARAFPQLQQQKQRPTEMLYADYKG